ncbi:fluoride efflux transporter FluC [Shouchella lehensis]|uniref:Fluoride-specific ion channel FluC n=2 Tax=Shouchella lehensis TaxID=300825 RepID=A0A060M6L6_9BACI|nr:CrcB family protein [Shouchella lehensis]AIC95744.1 camphor resistance protein CrcB-like protein 2 [Shouchella lehensis G1]MBG9783545.1 hypothetical protein [Shouchella lehensis]RQW21448.1 fluoride efflux transporter CrcB [Bacillus sp. C1-1]TES51467.1 fluoride efflux transporter CrcB [Shouchella lehensis]
MLTTLLLVSIGGGTGAFLRFIIGEFLTLHYKWSRCFTVIAFINIVGSTVLGVAVAAKPSSVFELFILYLCGGFTTFSTFSLEALQGFLDKEWIKGISYIIVTVIGSMLGFGLGFVILF